MLSLLNFLLLLPLVLFLLIYFYFDYWVFVLGFVGLSPGLIFVWAQLGLHSIVAWGCCWGCMEWGVVGRRVRWHWETRVGRHRHAQTRCILYKLEHFLYRFHSEFSHLFFLIFVVVIFANLHLSLLFVVDVAVVIAVFHLFLSHFASHYNYYNYFIIWFSFFLIFVYIFAACKLKLLLKTSSQIHTHTHAHTHKNVVSLI